MGGYEGSGVWESDGSGVWEGMNGVWKGVVWDVGE